MKKFHSLIYTIIISALLTPFITQAKTEIAIFSGGCFWCMQPPYDKLDGVKKTEVGYIGGKKETADYKLVSKGKTKHVEALRVYYDPKSVSYSELLDVFWHNIDPTDDTGQFCDKGEQYRSQIFYKNDTQKNDILKSKEALEKKYNITVLTEILPLESFYLAEDYHQDYYKKNPKRYNLYRYLCGRDKKLEQLYGDK